MPTAFLQGDLFEDAATPEAHRALAFGADSAGKMSSGIAAAFRKQWPALADAYAAHAAGGKAQLGDVFAWREGPLGIYVLVLEKPGATAKISTFEVALRALLARAEEDGVTTVSVPRFGAGKNGMDWARVRRVLEDVGADSPVSVAVYAQFVRSEASG